MAARSFSRDRAALRGARSGCGASIGKGGWGSSGFRNETGRFPVLPTTWRFLSKLRPGRVELMSASHPLRTMIG